MTKPFNFLVLVAALSSTLLVSGCSAQNLVATPAPGTSESASVEGKNDASAYTYTPTQAQVDRAFKSLNRNIDEFTGDEVVTHEIPTSAYSEGESPGTRGFVVAQFQRRDGADWKFQFAGSYLGDDWIFFDSIELKSATGSMKMQVFRQNKVEKVLGGGKVGEVGGIFLSTGEINELYSLANGGAVKFRLSSSRASQENFVGVLSDQLQKRMLNVLVAYFGTMQGLTVY